MTRARLLLAGFVAGAVLLALPHAAHAAGGAPRHISQGDAIHLCRTAQRVSLGAALGLASTVAGAGGERLLALTPLTCSGTTAAGGVAWNWQVQQPRHSTRARQSGTRHTGRALRLPAYTPLGAAQGSSGNASIDMPQLLAKVLVVFLLLFVCLRVLKAVMPRLNGSSDAAGGLVLHSEPLGPKARVQVLDLGLRVVMVAVSGPSITTLATIDDAAEMAELRERYAPKGRKRLARRKEAKAPGERPTFAQALALTSRQALGRGARPEDVDATPAPRDTVAPAREWEQELAAAMAAPAPQVSHDGDPVLGGALESLRSLRQQVERR